MSRQKFSTSFSTVGHQLTCSAATTDASLMLGIWLKNIPVTKSKALTRLSDAQHYLHNFSFIYAKA